MNGEKDSSFWAAVAWTCAFFVLVVVMIWYLASKPE